MKVAHVLRGLEPGGVEKWLVDLTYVNKKSSDPVIFDFILQNKHEVFFEEDIIENDGHVIKLEYNKKNIISYLFQLYREFKVNQYDVVHSHVYHFSGIVLLIAFLAGIKTRVSHCHNDKSAINNKSGLVRKVYHKLSRSLLELFSTQKIAVSQLAADSLYNSSNNLQLIPCGIYFEPNLPVYPITLEKRKLTLMNVGSFVFQKNHDFIIKLCRELKARNADFICYLIGAGALEKDIIDQINQYKLNEDVILLGKRKDVHQIMSNVANVFVFPSHFEGLGLAAIESQYYGVNTLVSEKLPEELDVSDFIEFLPIHDDAVKHWADIIVSITPISMSSKVDCVDRIRASNLSVENNYVKMLDVYRLKGNLC
jgi:glycosyltransferase involved in cell wall biosynthesis